MTPIPDQVRTELAPTGVLRAAINMSNFLLVSGQDATGAPVGVAPGLASAIASRLGVPVRYVPFPRPGDLADAAGTGVWDIGLIGAEPARAERIAFTPAYVEIEATYLVPAGSPLQAVHEVDRAGIRIASTARAAYDLWLERNIRAATWSGRTVSTPRSPNSSPSGSMHWPVLRRGCWPISIGCPGPAFCQGGSPRCSRRLGRGETTRPQRRSCGRSWRRPRRPAWSPV